jgi:peroxiredoxin
MLASAASIHRDDSKDSITSHGEFISKYDLNFPLLSDEDLEVHKTYSAATRNER